MRGGCCTYGVATPTITHTKIFLEKNAVKVSILSVKHIVLKNIPIGQKENSHKNVSYFFVLLHKEGPGLLMVGLQQPQTLYAVYPLESKLERLKPLSESCHNLLLAMN